MFSYRHAFHAGNHADVLKHLVLIQILQYMIQKDAACMVIDTHAGAGIYSLGSDYARKNAEYETGISRLWNRDDLPEAVADYVKLVRSMNPSEKLKYYPGSPFCAEAVMREQDRLRLFEMHPTEGRVLEDNFRKLEEASPRSGGRGKRVMIQKGDGFLGLKALLPPPSRRGLVLIDPPYEDKSDYRRVKDAITESMARFPTGTYAVWYPLLNRLESRQLPDRLKKIPGAEWLNATLTIGRPLPDGFGLRSSGMFIINPPYTLEPMLREVLPYLVEALAEDSGAFFTVESGTAAAPKPRKPA